MRFGMPWDEGDAPRRWPDARFRCRIDAAMTPWMRPRLGRRHRVLGADNVRRRGPPYSRTTCNFKNCACAKSGCITLSLSFYAHGFLSYPVLAAAGGCRGDQIDVASVNLCRARNPGFDPGRPISASRSEAAVACQSEAKFAKWAKQLTPAISRTRHHRAKRP
jgi:hypothetical protein